MPGTKIINITTWPEVDKLRNYLENQKHEHHQEYFVGPLLSAHPTLNPAQLRSAVEKTFRKITAEKRRGSPIKNLFTLHICRIPDLPKGHWLTPEEREEFARNYLATVAPEGLALYNWHIHRGSGADDFNALVVNLTDLERPRARRRRDINPIDDAREAADMITDVLNAKRRAQNRPHILTMPERMRQIFAQKMGASLERKLSLHPQPVYLKNLRAVIKEMGHEVTRYNEDNDSISIKFRFPDEDEETATKRKATRLKITALLAEVLRLRRNPELVEEFTPQLTPEQGRAVEQAEAFEMPRDEGRDRLLDEWANEQQPMQQHSPEPPIKPSPSPIPSR